MTSGFQLKVFLAGHVSAESDGVVIDEARFPGRQGRLLFAYLVAEQGRPVPRDELAEVRGGALSALADACLRSGDAPEAARWGEQMIALEPFRETGYRRLMEAHAAAGNRAEALQVYERCRRLLSEELGTYPSPETEAVYRQLPPNSPSGATAKDDQRDREGISVPPSAVSEPAKRDRRKLAALVAALLLVVGAAAITLVLTSGSEAPLEVLPNSVVRIDPDTL